MRKETMAVRGGYDELNEDVHPDEYCEHTGTYYGKAKEGDEVVDYNRNYTTDLVEIVDPN